MDTLQCKNCGAPLHSFVCEYCGTQYVSENNSGDNIRSAVEEIQKQYEAGIISSNELRRRLGLEPLCDTVDEVLLYADNLIYSHFTDDTPKDQGL